MSKVRIYDLAKELKQESKRLLEEVRREGVDVSVPSNTISKELAEKIRNRYFPKKEVVTQRTVRVVKKAQRHVEADASDEAPVEAPPASDTTAATEAVGAISEPPGAVAATPPAAAVDTADATDTAAKPFAARLVKKLAPAARAEQPASTHRARRHRCHHRDAARTRITQRRDRRAGNRCAAARS